MDKTVELGSKQMKEFENGWHKNSNDKLSRVVKTQVESGKYISRLVTPRCIIQSSFTQE